MIEIITKIGLFIGALKNGIPLLIGAILIIGVAKLIRDMATSFDDNKILFEDDNRALGIATAGYYIGILIAITGALAGTSNGFWIDLRDLAVYGFLAIVLQNIARVIADKFILTEFSIDDELIKDKNCGTAWVMFGLYFATGFIVRGAIMGESTGLLLGIAVSTYYFILSQIALIVLAYIYQLFTPYDFHEEIESDNVAAGLAFAGFISAMGVIISNAGGDNFNLADTFNFFLWTATGAAILACARKVLVDCIDSYLITITITTCEVRCIHDIEPITISNSTNQFTCSFISGFDKCTINSSSTFTYCSKYNIRYIYHCYSPIQFFFLSSFLIHNLSFRYWRMPILAILCSSSLPNIDFS